jgi:hypothetical protein
VPEHQEARQSAAGAVTWRKSLPPKFPLDTQDACILVGLLTMVAGIALFSLAAALIVGGALVAILAITWPSKRGA